MDKPFISDDLLAYVRKTFDMGMPTPDMDDRRIWINVGKHEVVKHFEGLYRKQNSPKEYEHVPTVTQGSAAYPGQRASGPHRRGS